MKNFYKILVLIIFTIMLAVPAKTYALESPSTESTNESNELEVAVTNNEQDEELDEIKDIISDNIDVDLLESQGFDYDENNESLVEKEVVNEIEKKLDENNINHDDLSFVGDIVNPNNFSYSGEIHIYKGNDLVGTVNTGVTYSNTDQHTAAEQSHVNNFIESNSFVFVEEIDLENYENANFSPESKLNTLAADYGITCKSMLPPYAGATGDYPFACFFNDKFYGTLIANLELIINVNVPSNVTNDSEYVIKAVKNYFISYFANRGITDYITQNTNLYYNNGLIYGDNNIYLGKFKYTKAKPTPVTPQQPTNNNQSSNTSTNYNNSSRGSSYGYSTSYKTYYTANEDEPEVKETTEETTKVEDTKKEETKKEKTTKKETKKESKKETKKETKKDSKDEKKSEGNVKKILFILVASILSVGIVLFAVDKFFIK